MKLKKFSFILLPLLILTAFLFSSCDDSGIITPTSKNPNIQFKSGATYYYWNDTISRNGNENYFGWLTTDIIQPIDTNYQGRSCYPVSSVTRDTVLPLNPIIRQTTDYYSYTQTEGKFYQYGAKKIIDSTQQASWDLVADFTKSIGTEISLYTIQRLFNNPLVSANVFSKVAADTVIVTTASGVTVNCYRVALRAEIQLSGLPIGNAYIDYYIGYTPTSNPLNPSGRVRTRVQPINLNGLLTAPGADQKLSRFILP